MKRATLAFCLFAAASAQAMDIDKDILAAAVLGIDLQPAWTNAINDLLPDPVFGSNGSKPYFFDDGAGSNEAAMRIFPSSDGGYWLAGWHSGLSLAIAKLKADGTYDTAYGSGGKKTIPTTMLNVYDVAKSGNDTLYFVGTRHTGSNADLDIEVACIDSSGTPCSGFGPGGNGIKGVWLDLGTDAQNKDDVPYAITWFASQLFIVGETDTGSGALKNKAAFAINLNPTTGAQNTAFGNFPARPGVFVHNPDHATNGRDTALGVLAYAPSPFAYRLVLVGETQRAQAGGEDTDGFVLSLNGVTGQVDDFLDDDVFADLGTRGKDKLTQVMRRRNGGFIVAGTAADDSATPTQFQLLLAAYRADGSADNGFNAGSNKRHALVLSGRNVPYGLAERADTRDLVVGINASDDLFGDGHALQAVVQFDRNGGTLHAMSVLDFAASTTADKGSWGSHLFLDGGGRVVTAGYRCWKKGAVGPLTLCIDQDMTAARFIANDTLFADGFGKSDSD